jgi:hypothetical protein
MTQIIKPKNSTLTVDCQSKMINILNQEFTEEENRWYIANLYIYMNYHPTNDYPINLETLVKLVGFKHKANAKRTLKIIKSCSSLKMSRSELMVALD